MRLLGLSDLVSWLIVRNSKVSELYDTIKYCALHHRTFLFAIFNERPDRVNPSHPPQDRRMHELYSRAKALFDLVAPQEYGIDPDEKFVILPLILIAPQRITGTKSVFSHHYLYSTTLWKILNMLVTTGPAH